LSRPPLRARSETLLQGPTGGRPQDTCLGLGHLVERRPDLDDTGAHSRIADAVVDLRRELLGQLRLGSPVDIQDPAPVSSETCPVQQTT
jgi:hypothetical protein